ncbi:MULTISPECIES: hypothetical protein [Stenotrophomonas]|uniref:hypothetical protein n=1 Tax=Stenotrophomonas TaxID=40323 RepID=UPI000F6729E9|nr:MULTISPECIES: hypothetical protein [Stenotrophomonas]RRU03928.1 hypothetical protein EGJ06_19060 [Stenotrophomonas maltophilia]RRU07003.1 hypothetical protein EGJ77_19415 [Stenotrophomonas maltophilia]RRU36571.1 hypothetical protein EGJ03_00205 [Stenotrophomonas maltophilia]RRU88255.1 hypothetical protein EGI98_02455 [Stenotrophomonas maltophilia]RRU90126.1 hypothetical protein EGI91_19565 [Stenotrophomonas maltophilia]
MNVFRSLGLVSIGLVACILGPYSVEASEDQTGSLALELASALQETHKSLAPIRTKAELERHLAADESSPLRKLSAESQRKFVDSLVFLDGGLASYSHLPLRDLSVSDSYRVLALFGAQGDLSLNKTREAVNSSEESMLLLSNVEVAAFPPTRYPNAVCMVRGPKLAMCEYDYGSTCDGTVCKPKR